MATFVVRLRIPTILAFNHHTKFQQAFMQTSERQAERCENTLTLSHLAALPKRNKDHFLSTFTQQQRHFSQQYVYEGQRAARSWNDRSSPIIDPPKNDPQLGFGTPVLRARLDLISARMGPPNSRNQVAGGQESSKENEKPSGHNANSLATAKPELKAEWQKKNVSQVDKKRSKEHISLSDSDNELAERYADRRRRKKTKRDIMNPNVSGDSDNEGKPSTTCKGRKNAKHQSKLRQEFALMHGFSSTNVGKNRLTLKPGHRDIGVFQKGKASEKTDVVQAGKHKRQGSDFRFSEATFLGKPRQKVNNINFKRMAKIAMAKEEDSTVVSSGSASIPHSTKARSDSDMAEVESRKFKDNKAPSKSNLVSKTKPQSQDKPQTGYNPANSIVWDIEQAHSEVSSGVKQGTIILKVNHLPLASNEVFGNEALDMNIPTLDTRTRIKSSQQKSLSGTQSDVLSSPSLGPSQSASQNALRTVNVASPPTAFSKYFKPLSPRPVEPHLATINQLDTKTSALSELVELSTIKDTVCQMLEPGFHLQSAGPSARTYCDGQEESPDLIPPLQPNYDLEVSAYEHYPDPEFWSPVDYPGDLSLEYSDNIDNIVDHVNMSFDGEINPSFVKSADEAWTLDYIGCRELDEMDQIHDTSFIPLSEHQSMEMHDSLSPSWLSDAYGDVSESCQGVVYQYSDRLLSINPGSEDQPDDSNLEHEGVSSMDLELYPDAVHHFWQGGSLLHGLSTTGGSSSLHKISNVEADVARQLQLDHWQPQKL